MSNERTKEKKQWCKGELIVLVRGKSEEAVLDGCKLAAYEGPQSPQS